MDKHNNCESVATVPTPRAELLAKVNGIVAGMAQWHGLLTALVEGFPPTASNLAQVAKLGAGLLMQEGAGLAELSQKLTKPTMPPAVVERTGKEVRS
ncbi:hypothetical protein DesfrDRAFT_1386 [Solidesulfovibrio fructosivorans JJ]]|uniref:Uncharacterized protein n=1 Tax=Solidesulfovibrio fructosivorans JJ] TaxID=596151 RepID=E1JUT7_SOLFR|nr:hypothetical protein [Solidesulfovibrio fructosivorans]EFL51851.1 hypothetical protein DesfrDRAFT_1386 [Solidesulfovibrio fructosivorans JJ]]